MMLVRRNNNDLMNSLFNDLFFDQWTPRMDTTTPAVNIKENDKAFEVEVAAPGLKKEFCRVELDHEGNLKVKLEAKFEHKDEDKKEHYLRREFAYTNFENTYKLPKNVDKEQIAARVEDGILYITLPKYVEEPKKVTKMIDIK